MEELNQLFIEIQYGDWVWQDQKNKNLRPGIYRVKADQGKDGAAIPLFKYGSLPSIKAKPTFGDLVENIVNSQFPNILQKNINKVGKKI